MNRNFANISAEECIEFNRGVFPAGYSKYEKPGTSEFVAHWNSTNCIQCNICVMSCPHASIRAFNVNNSEAFEGFDTISVVKSDNTGFRVQVSPLDCRGCKVCVLACPKKCIELKPL